MPELKRGTMRDLPTAWRDEADAMREEELRNAIVEAENNLKTIDQEQRENEKLTALKVAVAEASAGYRDGRRAQRAKIDYALHLLAQKGKI